MAFSETATLQDEFVDADQLVVGAEEIASYEVRRRLLRVVPSPLTATRPTLSSPQA